MSSNQEKILNQYGDGTREAVRSKRSRTSSLEFYYTKKHLEGFITKESRVLEVGCATGYYGLYFADKCKEYVGIDICPPNIEIFEQIIAENRLENVSCRIGDAVNLEDFIDESFDIVLCLGPMYHLPAEERELVFTECSRVCKKEGVIAFAYINKVGVYAGACVYYEPGRYPNDTANEFIINRGTDDLKPDVLYFTVPEEIEDMAAKHGLSKIKNFGTDFFITMKVVDDMTNEQFEVMKPLYDQMTSHESCTGMSNHALLICRK